MTIASIIIQGIGFVAVAAFILSYQIKSNRWLFLLQLIGSALFCLQFFLLDAFSGCLSLAVNILRNALMMKYSEWKWVRWKGCQSACLYRLCVQYICILVKQSPQY